MTHDRLCPPGWWLEGDGPCEFCALIARVREDERKTDDSGLLYLNQTHFNDMLNGMRRISYAAALRHAVEAVDAERTEDPSWDGTNWNNALTVAREVIEALAKRERNDWQNGSVVADLLT